MIFFYSVQCVAAISGTVVDLHDQRNMSQDILVESDDVMSGSVSQLWRRDLAKKKNFWVENTCSVTIDIYFLLISV